MYILFQPKVLRRNANRREYFRTSIVQYVDEKRTRRSFRDVFRVLPRFLLNKIANCMFENVAKIYESLNTIRMYLHIYIL